MYIYTNLNIKAIGGSSEQPLLGPSDKALSQPKPHPSNKTVCQAYKICSKETPDWKALEAAKTLTVWALT